MQMIDLRSDTVTLPTRPMREAMNQAELGDDVMGEDPTVNRLEAYAAQLLRKESALYLPSGTMANLAAVLAHCQRGDEVILGNLSHTFLYEAGGIAALGGIHPYQVQNQSDGTLLLEDVERAIRPDDFHFPTSRLVCIENTQNRCGGVVLSVEYTHAIAELAHGHGLKIHLDGARIFNAAIALGVAPAELVGPVDSVMFCLSKSLCAPIGSMLCGSRDFVQKARRIRKQLGGGMRQVGVIAAAGLYALEHMVERLGEDHVRAQALATELSGIEGLQVEVVVPRTNMVYIRLGEHLKVTPKELADELLKRVEALLD